METPRQQEIVGITLRHEPIGIAEILAKMKIKVSIPTTNRDLSKLKSSNFILSEGNGSSTKYRINLKGLTRANINSDSYFEIYKNS